MKKLIAILLVLSMAFALAACNTGSGKTTYAIVCKDGSNPYMQKMIEGFKKGCEDLGVECMEKSPATTSVDDQIKIVNELVAQGVKGIAIAANDAAALEATIKEAKAKGVVVVTLDSDTKGSQLFVNQAGVEQVAQVLVDSVADMCGADGGDFAILSASSTATNQNAWIDAMKEILKQEKYANLNLVATVYGDDEPTKSTTETQNLLINHENLEVICCPTTVGILACAQEVQKQGKNVKVAGLGLPSEMKDYVGDDKVCPYMYLWNPIDVGNCAAYMIKAIADGKVGAVDSKFTADNKSEYTVMAGDPAEKQIIVGPPFKFDGNNIGEWASVY